MDVVSAKDAKQSLGRVLDRAQRSPVRVTKRGRTVAVIMSIEDFERREAAYQEAETERLLDELCADPVKLAKLRERLRAGVTDLDNGRSKPAAVVFERLEQKYAQETEILAVVDEERKTYAVGS